MSGGGRSGARAPIVIGILAAITGCTSDGTNDDIAVCRQQGGRWVTSSSCESAHCEYSFTGAPLTVGPSGEEPVEGGSPEPE